MLLKDSQPGASWKGQLEGPALLMDHYIILLECVCVYEVIDMGMQKQSNTHPNTHTHILRLSFEVKQILFIL